MKKFLISLTLILVLVFSFNSLKDFKIQKCQPYTEVCVLDKNCHNKIKSFNDCFTFYFKNKTKCACKKGI